MDYIDIGTLVSAVSAFLVAGTIGFREVLGRFMGRLRVSFVAFISSPSVWMAAALAAGVAFWGGWWLGHSAGAHNRSDLTAEISLLKEATARQAAAGADLARDLAEAQATIEGLRAASAAPQRAPTARRPVPRRSRAATVAPAAAFWPFER